MEQLDTNCGLSKRDRLLSLALNCDNLVTENFHHVQFRTCTRLGPNASGCALTPREYLSARGNDCESIRFSAVFLSFGSDAGGVLFVAPYGQGERHVIQLGRKA